MHVREALHLLASFHFLASFLFLLRDIAHMIHIRYIAHMVQNLVKHIDVTHTFLLVGCQSTLATLEVPPVQMAFFLPLGEPGFFPDLGAELL